MAFVIDASTCHMHMYEMEEISGDALWKIPHKMCKSHMYFPSAYLLRSRAFHFSASENRNFLSGWQINTSWPEIGLPKQRALLPPMQWFKPGSRLPQRRSGGFSRPAALTRCHATPSIIRLNFTQMLSVWFTQSAVHHCSALVCLPVGLHPGGCVVLARLQPKNSSAPLDTPACFSL